MDYKKIVAQFLGIEESLINSNTLINRQALKSSIFIHKLYGKLADTGIIISDYSNLNTFGELERIINGNNADNEISKHDNVINYSQNINENNIGIDIENISSLPETNDFRSEGFYLENFSDKEISYCVLQSDPYASFAGLFAVKEAIVKANPKYYNTKFKDINIQHNSQGKPEFNGMNISISHTESTAVAVAVIFKTETELIESKSTINEPLIENNTVNFNSYKIISILSIIFSIICIVLMIFKP